MVATCWGGSRTIWEVLKAPKIVQKRSVKVAEGEPEQILLTMKRTDSHLVQEECVRQ